MNKTASDIDTLVATNHKLIEKTVKTYQLLLENGWKTKDSVNHELWLTEWQATVAAYSATVEAWKAWKAAPITGATYSPNSVPQFDGFYTAIQQSAVRFPALFAVVDSTRIAWKLTEPGRLSTPAMVGVAAVLYGGVYLAFRGRY